tara:strand:- start:1780 stop:2097 length:318 start_codon:yes stop_codon:yes gene_type:complete
MKKVLIALSLLALTACSKQSYIMSSKKGELTHEYNNSFFLGGIGQTEDNDAVKMCAGQQNITMVETQRTFGNGLVSVVTLGIYTPMKVRVYCKKDRFRTPVRGAY